MKRHTLHAAALGRIGGTYSAVATYLCRLPELYTSMQAALLLQCVCLAVGFVWHADANMHFANPCSGYNITNADNLARLTTCCAGSLLCVVSTTLQTPGLSYLPEARLSVSLSEQMQVCL